MIASYETRPISRPSPKPYYSFSLDPTLHHSHAHTHTHSLPTTPLASSSKPRPKMPLVKKPSCSTRDKRHEVQHNLETKVEKSKGFHAFFVPLGRSLPPAPPSSPVLGASTTHQTGGGVGGEGVGKDYFEDWVEDVGGSKGSGSGKGRGEGMDLD